MADSVEDRYAKARTARQRCVDAILTSESRKKVVVAGPGTGKTFLFKQILKGKGNSLTLTFVNSLVEDLSLDLCGLSEVKTLHGFARSIMGKAIDNVRVFPKLSKIIAEDLKILKGQDVDFDFLFHNRDDMNENIPFYKRRRMMYGHYGFADIIYAAVLYLEIKPEKVPIFNQVLIDEFQDFNRLEVSFIDLLASKSPIVIAGDDDQSLYYFKSASPVHIRQRYSEDNQDYTSFNLPHCSRCTRAIVEAVNDITVAAKAEGFLKDRIDKPYLFFEDEKKEADCERYPKLVHVTCFATQAPFFVAKAIRAIAEDRQEKFSVLIIAPTNVRCGKIAQALKDKGFENVRHADGERNSEATLFDSLILLADDPKCSLGWRIAAKCMLSEDDFRDFIEDTETAERDKFRDLVDLDVQLELDSIISAFKKVAKGETPKAEQLAKLLQRLGLDPETLTQQTLRAKVEASRPKGSDPATRNISIKITTIPSSKGLAEDYVFISDFDDRFLLGKDGKCSDQKIFDVIVALTRARRKVFLLSSEARDSKFLTWIAKERIERVKL
jgi:AAA domain